MREVVGNIWAMANRDPLPAIIVVPTNIGWRDSDDHAVMGRGLALVAKRRYPALTTWYGALCKRFGAKTGVAQYRELILFPTKPLNVGAPWRSWMGESSPSLIERSLTELALYSPAEPHSFYVPYVGCGNGGLEKPAILPLIRKHLGTRDDVILVDLPEKGLD